MGRVAIITESAATLPAELVAEYDLRVLPLKIIWGEEVLVDGVDITPEALYERLEATGDEELPTTTTVTPAEFLGALEQAAEDGYEAAVAVLLPKELSGSVQSAMLARAMDPPIPLTVVDSRTVSMAQGFVALAAARKAAEGAAAERVVKAAQEMIPRVHFYAALETLSYLKRGGRIGSAASLLGSALRLKPIVTIPPGMGQVEGAAKPRTWKRAMRRMVGLMQREMGERPVHVAVSHGNRLEAAQELLECIAERFEIREAYITYFTAVMGVHAGPVVSVSFYGEKEP